MQALVALYERLSVSKDPKRRLPELGWQEREIAFLVDLDPDGVPIALIALREPQAKGRTRAPLRLVPQEGIRKGRIPNEVTENNCGRASLFWDNPKYALGLPADDDAKSIREAEVCHELFKLRHERFAREGAAEVTADVGLHALLRFLDRGALNALAAIDSAWINAVREFSGNVAFLLHGDPDLICRRPAIRAAISAPMAGEGPPAVSQCLVSGLTTRIARLHPSIQGVAGAPSTGATIVTFNYPAFESYGLLQGQNAPVGVYAAFAYTTALNKLLRYDSTSVTRAGTTTVVFWAGQETANEAVLCNLMSSMAGDEPWRDGVTIADLYAAPQPGVPPPVEDTTPFFILALSAESGRLTMRFFHQDTVAGMARSLVRWFDELTIAPIMPPLSLAGLLCGISIQGDIKNAPPLLGSELLRSAYTGMPLPHQLLAEALVRSAVEQGPTHERVSLLKSYLMRNYGRNITVALDPDDIDPSYRLGRLFAVLENLQKTAVNTNRTIRDSYWSAASSMPATIFPHLLDLAVVHLMKIKQNRIALALWFERRIGEIAAALPTSLPTLMTLEMQGRFAIGYWHQRYVPRPERLTAEEPAIEPAVEVP